MPYAQDQYSLLQDDFDGFLEKRDPENYDKRLVKRMMVTRAGLRADQIIRMVEQAYNRAEIAADGNRYYMWLSMRRHRQAKAPRARL